MDSTSQREHIIILPARRPIHACVVTRPCMEVAQQLAALDASIMLAPMRLLTGINYTDLPTSMGSAATAASSHTKAIAWLARLGSGLNIKSR